jgi:hypothetical protein
MVYDSSIVEKAIKINRAHANSQDAKNILQFLREQNMENALFCVLL